MALDGADLFALAARLRAAGCVFAEDEARVLAAAASDRPSLEALVLRRCAGEPLEHVVGWASFCGRRVELDPGVFVPRRRTELLARLAIAHARAIAHAHAAAPRALVVDLCCGSGAVGLVVAEAVPGVELHAADLDPRAVRCARRNLAGAGEVHHGDLFAPLPTALRGRVDVLIANVPYVPTSAVALLPREAREHEPRSALDGGGDGLDVLRRVLAGASTWLAAGGALLSEVSDDQVDAASRTAAAAGLLAHAERDADLGATVVAALRQSSNAL